MSLKTGVAATVLTAFGLFLHNADTFGQTVPSQPLKKPTPHYLLGVPLPKFEVGGRILKPTFRVYFPEDPGGFYKNQKEILRKSMTNGDRRVHPASPIQDKNIINPTFEIDTVPQGIRHIRQEPVHSLNMG